jgi:hypothetical protein
MALTILESRVLLPTGEKVPKADEGRVSKKAMGVTVWVASEDPRVMRDRRLTVRL